MSCMRLLQLNYRIYFFTWCFVKEISNQRQIGFVWWRTNLDSFVKGKLILKDDKFQLFLTIQFLV